jgi:glutamate-5-semialdehyde dehydrogenase
MDLHTIISDIGQRALEASRKLALLTTEERSNAVRALADAIVEDSTAIYEANALDVADAKAAGLSDAMVDRLTLTPARFKSMVDGVMQVASLPDPVGQTLSTIERPNGIRIEKRRVPLGVIAIIYESRPNVTADAASLCLKTANAVILRGGKETLRSNAAIADALRKGAVKAGVPVDAIQFISIRDHEAVKELVQLDGMVDVVIPRGGERLVRAVVANSHIPVLKHYKGLCHLYVAADADLENAIPMIDNAKCQRPSACNAIETLLVDASIAPVFLPKVAAWAVEKGVELVGDAATCAILPELAAADDADWDEEYLALKLSIKVVSDATEAIAHINRHGTHHSDCILTADARLGERFLAEVDSAAVYVNASTRFTDGGEFGMGAEMGISTDKFHARGPVGLEELTSYKWLVRGSGQIRN